MFSKSVSRQPFINAEMDFSQNEKTVKSKEIFYLNNPSIKQKIQFQKMRPSMDIDNLQFCNMSKKFNYKFSLSCDRNKSKEKNVLNNTEQKYKLTLMSTEKTEDDSKKKGILYKYKDTNIKMPVTQINIQNPNIINFYNFYNISNNKKTKNSEIFPNIDNFRSPGCSSNVETKIITVNNKNILVNNINTYTNNINTNAPNTPSANRNATLLRESPSDNKILQVNKNNNNNVNYFNKNSNNNTIKNAHLLQNYNINIHKTNNKLHNIFSKIDPENYGNKIKNEHEESPVKMYINTLNNDSGHYLGNKIKDELYGIKSDANKKKFVPFIRKSNKEELKKNFKIKLSKTSNLTLFDKEEKHNANPNVKSCKNIQKEKMFKEYNKEQQSLTKRKKMLGRNEMNEDSAIPDSFLDELNNIIGTVDNINDYNFKSVSKESFKLDDTYEIHKKSKENAKPNEPNMNTNPSNKNNNTNDNDNEANNDVLNNSFECYDGVDDLEDNEINFNKEYLFTNKVIEDDEKEKNITIENLKRRNEAKARPGTSYGGLEFRKNKLKNNLGKGKSAVFFDKQGKHHLGN